MNKRVQIVGIQTGEIYKDLNTRYKTATIGSEKATHPNKIMRIADTVLSMKLPPVNLIGQGAIGCVLLVCQAARLIDALRPIIKIDRAPPFP